MKHLIPILEGGLIFLSLEVFLFKPEWLLFIVLSVLAIIILGMLIPKRKFLGIKEFWNYSLSPLIFSWTAILLLLFFENIFFKHFFALAISIYVFFYFENLFYYIVSSDENKRITFLRMTNMMNVVSIFFLAAGLYGIKTFIQFSIWILSIIFFIFSTGLLFNSLWIINQKFNQIIWEVLIVAFIISELFLVIHFLPIGFYASGALVGIVYYVSAGILTSYIRKTEIPIRRYTIIGLILLLLVILTARWV